MASNDSVRHQLSSDVTMLKYFAEIERMVFAAETYCADAHNVKVSECTGQIENCPFRNRNEAVCSLKEMRNLVGEP